MTVWRYALVGLAGASTHALTLTSWQNTHGRAAGLPGVLPRDGVGFFVRNVCSESPGRKSERSVSAAVCSATSHQKRIVLCLVYA